MGVTTLVRKVTNKDTHCQSLINPVKVYLIIIIIPIVVVVVVVILLLVVTVSSILSVLM